jgi:hypothetical protein
MVGRWSRCVATAAAEQFNAKQSKYCASYQIKQSAQQVESGFCVYWTHINYVVDAPEDKRAYPEKQKEHQHFFFGLRYFEA